VAALPPSEPARAEPPAAAAALPAPLAEQVANLAAADPALRFEAVDVLIESKEPKVLVHLLPLVRDPDAFVRRLTVEGLREFRRPAAVDALLEALADEDENVCDTAWRSLRDVTGQRLPFDASASKEARSRAAKKWRDWWAGARDTFGG
ncbi:MAG: HEAT repeat domain-containing protein, partial [Planctomycetota bacterium]